MSEPFLGEIKIITFNYPPKGWAFCNGQLLPINQNQALFSLLGTTYGGNGTTTFALPDLRGRTPMHIGAGFIQGQAGGETSHTLTVNEMPSHVHSLYANPNTATSLDPTQNVLALTTEVSYAPTPNSAMAGASVSSVGGSQPHENRQPSLVLNFVIALQGIYPSQN
ncbi:phage tail protein [Oculatella sp. LEGE 06141]|uniref:phage tail protein n=1 Tax=Oculatella sp. LEGE 06141 TaxID=1828648 RepID=UPI0018825A39|nr:tail fiber protein [Oculatella sp. LEGE 06141]MBE9180907.1 phage tail protein [Oculatella sp. LEGE 06141]